VRIRKAATSKSDSFLGGLIGVVVGTGGSVTDRSVTMTINGNAAWASEGSTTIQMPKEIETELRDAIYMNQCTHLLMLLNDDVQLVKTFPNGQPTMLTVRKAGKPDIEMVFDPQSGLITKTTFKTKDKNGSDVYATTEYGDYQNFNGVNLAKRSRTTKTNGLDETDVIESIVPISPANMPPATFRVPPGISR
jgi:hypothetical protein